MYDQVEAAMAAGVSRAAIRDELAALGLDMTLATFDLTLKRIRRERRSQEHAPRATQSPLAATSPAPSPAAAPDPTVALPDAAPPMSPAQYRQLSPAERKAIREAEMDKYFPDPYKKLSV